MLLRTLRMGVFWFLVFVTPLAADVLVLRNGTRIDGDIIGQSRTSMRVKTASGKIVSVRKSDIKTVRYGPSAAEAGRLKELERRRRVEAEKRAEEERKRKEAEAKRKAEEERKAAEERKAEEERKRREAEAARLKKEEEARRKAADAKTDADKKEEKEIQPKDDSTPSISRGSVLWRSALLPGWGQWHSGRRGSALGIGGLFLLSAGASASARGAAATAKSAYDGDVNLNFIVGMGGDTAAEAAAINLVLNSGKYEAYQAKIDQANQLTAVVGLLYLGQLIHALFMDLSPPAASNTATRSAPKFSLFLAPDKKTGPLPYSTQVTGVHAHLRFNWRF